MGNEQKQQGPVIQMPTPAEIKTFIMIAQGKLNLYRNKKLDVIRKKKMEIANTLKENNLDVAKAKMDSLIREEDYITVYDILTPLLEILKERVTYIVSSAECPSDLRAQLDSVIFASTRLEVEELYKLRDLIMRKYGSAYIQKAENNVDKLVNINLVEKLKIKPPSDAFLIIRLKQLCKEKKIPFEFPSEITTDIPGGDIGNPFSANQGPGGDFNPYASIQGNPFGPPGGNPYGPPGGNPYGPPPGGNNFGPQQAGNPFGPPGDNPYGPPQGGNNPNPYGPNINNNPFGSQMNNNNNQGNPYGSQMNNNNNQGNPFGSQMNNNNNQGNPFGSQMNNNNNQGNPYGSQMNNNNQENPFGSQMNNNNNNNFNQNASQDFLGGETILKTQPPPDGMMNNNSAMEPGKSDNPYSSNNNNNSSNPFNNNSNNNPFENNNTGNPFTNENNNNNPYSNNNSMSNPFGQESNNPFEQKGSQMNNNDGIPKGDSEEGNPYG